ncbi:hypothetical protein J7K27_04675 [Candidatus Bathyarchaeota archaeon]|nr:hypothetical protein [Candidatus Bathyarchaeota archaeon]
MDKKVLVSMLVIGLVSALAGAGIYAYFSDTATSSNNVFTAGTFDLKLSNDGSNYYDSVSATWTASDWAPGETCEATLYLRNVGSVPAKLVSVHGENLDGALADAVLLTKIVYTEGGTEYDVTDWFITQTGMDSDNDGKVTLTEFMAWSETYSMLFWTGDWGGDENYLPPDQHIILGFTFDPDAGNEFQGATVSFDIVVGAYQDWSQVTLAGKGSGCFGYGS